MVDATLWRPPPFSRNALHDPLWERKPISVAPPVLVAFGDYDAMRLRQFAAEHGGARVDGWNLFGTASLFSEAAE